MSETSTIRPLGDGKISDHERRYVDGKLVDIYIYDYYDEDGEVIYSARTVGGEVTEVWPGGYDPPITFSSPRRDYEEEEDPFNAPSYATEEDFYDDHYDDFFDYEEAADYYREHTPNSAKRAARTDMCERRDAWWARSFHEFALAVFSHNCSASASGSSPRSSATRAKVYCTNDGSLRLPRIGTGAM